MDYERKYRDALQRAKHALDCDRNNLVSTDVPLIYSMFPELKESEDEEVRKEIITFISTTPKQRNRHPKWINWLEKQGEVESDNDDIEVEEKGIREAFNKIEDEKQCKQKPIEWDADDDDKFFFLKARLKDYEDCIIYDEELSEWQKNNVRETTKEFLEWLDSIKERIGG